MITDRELQRFILITLQLSYPNAVSYEHIRDVFSKKHPEHCEYVRPLSEHPISQNLCYLEEHELVTFKRLKSWDSIDDFIVDMIKITAKGKDFLADDGGLSAILNTVTVKFDADNIRGLIEQGLLKSNLPEEKRHTIREALRSLPGSALQAITTKLIEKALDDPTGALKIIAATIGIKL